MGILSRMIPTEDASARKREIEEKLKQVRKERQEAGGTSLLVNYVKIIHVNLC